jgi:competence protein ComEC
MAGMAAQLQQPMLWSAAAYAGLILAAAVAGLWVRGRPLALVLAIAAFALTGLRAVAFQQQALPPALEGRDVLVRGVVAAMPQRGEFGPRFVLDVVDSEPAGVPPRLLLTWYDGPPVPAEADTPARTSPVLQAGAHWQFMVRLKAPHGLRNPHGFDHELWLWERGIQATGYVRAGPRDPAPRRIREADAWAPLERARQVVRDAIVDRVADPAAAGVLAGLAVGDQQAIGQAAWDLFRATGVAHLMSISGLHVTMFAWGAAALVGAFWRRSARLCLLWPAPHAALLGGVLLAALYAAFSGGGVPAQRTVWMLAVHALLRLAGLRWPWPRTWALTAAVVATLDPWALLQPGFWLSFVAVGILFATDPGGGAARPAGILGRLRALLREQAVITVALAPLTLWLFGEVSLVGLLANLAAIPWVTAVVTPLALAGIAWPPLWQAGAWAVQILMQGLQVLASVPAGVWSAAAPPVWMALAALAGGLLLVLQLPPALRALGLPLLWPMLVWAPPRPAPGVFEVVAADIGQGNAVLVRTATHSLLYDTGPRHGGDSDAGQRVLVPLLRALGERLDRVVVSHRDSDHSGGAASVLARHAQADLLSSMGPHEALSPRHPPIPCLAGQGWNWDGVRFEFLHPLASDYGMPAVKPNALSCVLRIVAAADPRPTSASEATGAPAAIALLAGDIERAQEARLVREAADALRADLLLVPHHGSKTSSSDVFLDAVQPGVALVQAGYRNRYGHPAPSVMERYARRGILVIVSPACGAARWSSAEPRRVRCERERSRRYWHHVGSPPAGLGDETGAP